MTDNTENGSSGSHRVENSGQLNFVLFEFSTQVMVDQAYLDSVVGDSDVSVWIGTADNPFHNHLTLSDSLFGTMSYGDTNTTTSTTARWADFNPNGVMGNVLIVAANVMETNDAFKISKLDVCAKATKFFVVDATADDTFEYGPTGQALANYNLNAANLNPRGVATTAAGNKVWVIDGNKKVYVYDVDGMLLSSWTANGLTTPEDITTNGTDIWIVDDGSNKVFRYANAANAANGAALNATSSFNLNSANANAKGIVTNGTSLWVVNDTPSTDKVFKYSTSGTLQGSWTIDSRNGSPTGITVDPSNVNHIWIVDSADRAVYRYHAAASRTSGSQNAASLFQLASQNTNAQGIADPPPNGIDLSDATVQDVGVFGLPQYVPSGLKDRVLADWLAPASTDKRQLRGTAIGAVSPAIRPLEATTQLSSRFASRKAHERLASIQLPGIAVRLNGSYSSAVDAAFGDKDMDRITSRAARDEIFADEDLTALDAMFETSADEILAEAVR